MLSVFLFVLSWQKAGFHLKDQDTKMLVLAALVFKMEDFIYTFRDFYTAMFILIIKQTLTLDNLKVLTMKGLSNISFFFYFLEVTGEE